MLESGPSREILAEWESGDLGFKKESLGSDSEGLRWDRCCWTSQIVCFERQGSMMRCTYRVLADADARDLAKSRAPKPHLGAAGRPGALGATPLDHVGFSKYVVAAVVVVGGSGSSAGSHQAAVNKATSVPALGHSMIATAEMRGPSRERGQPGGESRQLGFAVVAPWQQRMRSSKWRGLGGRGNDVFSVTVSI